MAWETNILCAVCCAVLCCVQGDMPFEDRDRVVNEFRRGETKILISTDVLARGFDVSQVRHKHCVPRIC